jgi:hypothetical protein
MPEAPNVMPIGLPLMRIDPSRLAAAATHWRERFAALPRPLIGVLVGGTTKPFVLDAQGARELLARAAAYREPAGSLFVTTSRRTPREAVAAFAAAMPPRAELFEWRPGAADNPYLGLLAHADGFVVTGDSMSMITEVARLGRPLAIHSLPEQARWWKHVRRALSRIVTKIPLGPLAKPFARLGLYSFNRDLTQVHGWLFEHKLAVPSGHAFANGSPPPDDELLAVAARIAEVARASAHDRRRPGVADREPAG